MGSNISEVVPRFFLTRNLIDCQKIDAKIVKLYLNGRQKKPYVFTHKALLLSLDYIPRKKEVEEHQTGSLWYVPLMLCNRVGWENFHWIKGKFCFRISSRLVVWSFLGQSTVPPLHWASHFNWNFSLKFKFSKKVTTMFLFWTELKTTNLVGLFRLPAACWIF